MIDPESALNPLEYAFKIYKPLILYSVSDKNIKSQSLSTNYLLDISLGFYKCEEKLLMKLYKTEHQDFIRKCLELDLDPETLYNSPLTLSKSLEYQRIEPILIA